MAVPSILKDNLSIPVIGSPLFIISNPDLVIAQCKAGVIGSFPALNARPEPVLEEWLDRITSELRDYDRNNPDNKAAPFAVNQIVHGSNARLKHDMDMCEKYEVPIIITSLGAKQWVNDQVHGWGGIVLHDIINNRFAKSAISKGADGLIAVAAGAGGHAGTYPPIVRFTERGIHGAGDEPHCPIPLITGLEYKAAPDGAVHLPPPDIRGHDSRPFEWVVAERRCCRDFAELPSGHLHLWEIAQLSWAAQGSPRQRRPPTSSGSPLHTCTKGVQRGETITLKNITTHSLSCWDVAL